MSAVKEEEREEGEEESHTHHPGQEGGVPLPATRLLENPGQDYHTINSSPAAVMTHSTVSMLGVGTKHRS